MTELIIIQIGIHLAQMFAVVFLIYRAASALSSIDGISRQCQVFEQCQLRLRAVRIMQACVLVSLALLYVIFRWMLLYTDMDLDFTDDVLALLVICTGSWMASQTIDLLLCLLQKAAR
jgi:hypothetical protein